MSYQNPSDKFIGRLENPLAIDLPILPFPGPRIMPVITMRRWHAPTHLRDLKFTQQVVEDDSGDIVDAI